MTMYDVDGNTTTNATEEASRVYYIVLSKLINDKSTSKIQVVKTTTKATIAIDLPEEVQLSAVPL